jgi:transposase
MARSKTGCAISAARRTPAAVAKLEAFLGAAQRAGNLKEWRRAKAVVDYIGRRRAAELASELRVARASINRWLQWYEADGVDGLRTKKAPGAAPRLSEDQRAELAKIIEAGPIAAGFTTGMWTGPLLGQLIRDRFGVSYHNHHVPRLLHQLGFSVQRPRKRLARADEESQATWLRERLPAIKKKPRPVAES